jgi:hypothetical protein
MHATEFALTLPDAFPLFHEPYFELEPVSEIGNSFEAAVSIFELTVFREVY